MAIPTVVQSLFPSDTDKIGYTFFRLAARPEFIDPGARFRLDAWWCSQLALLTYSEDAVFVGDALAKAGLIAQNADIANDDLRAMVVHDGNGVAFVCVRGTVLPPIELPPNLVLQMEAFSNWGKNLNFPQVNATIPGLAGKVHQGFQDSAQLLLSQIEAALKAIQNLKTIVFVGHSLGGAIATLLSGATDLPNASRLLVSFGMPRTGDAEFVQNLRVQHWRFVHGADLVPQVPAAILGGLWHPYAHHGTLYPLPREVSAQAEALTLVENALGPLSVADHEFAGLPLPSITQELIDHAPLLYAEKCFLLANV